MFNERLSSLSIVIEVVNSKNRFSKDIVYTGYVRNIETYL